ncbi:MAG: hypothetical protein OEY49_16255, partial [Candidatus Heimdallarchaeota archaeon]|nr:hypothetical protein [Candidatus Heimdallarchaeota archaeon]
LIPLQVDSIWLSNEIDKFKRINTGLTKAEIIDLIDEKFMFFIEQKDKLFYLSSLGMIYYNLIQSKYEKITSLSNNQIKIINPSSHRNIEGERPDKISDIKDKDVRTILNRFNYFDVKSITIKDFGIKKSNVQNAYMQLSKHEKLQLMGKLFTNQNTQNLLITFNNEISRDRCLEILGGQLHL